MGRMHITPLMVFRARAESRAMLVYAGVYDAEVCFNSLFDEAFACGLSAQVGDAVLHKIIARALKRYAEA
jgi:hypothetical protein